jgi:hypothetical protein
MLVGMKIKKSPKKKMTIEDLATRVDTRVDGLAAKMDGLATKADVDRKIGDLAKKIDTKIDTSIGDLAIKIQKGFMATAKQEDLFALTERVVILEKEMKGMHQNFDAVFQQLKEIKDAMKEADTSADVIDLQLRVSKLEKKIKA